MFSMVESGRKAITTLFHGRDDIYLAFGKFPDGYENSWTTTPPVVEEVTDPVLITEVGVLATDLLEEIGRRRVVISHYVVPDPGGIIGIGEDNFSVSDTPTNYLYIKFILDPSDGGSETICQLGLFVNVVPKNTVPPGQFWLLPSEIEEAGDLFLLENIATESMSPLEKTVMECVIEF